jgi:hypothetical protein
MSNIVYTDEAQQQQRRLQMYRDEAASARQGLAEINTATGLDLPLVRCWLRAERHDGNDPIEATVWMHRPMRGEMIEVWVCDAGFRNSPCPSRPEDVERGFSWSGEQRWLEVERVGHSVYDPVTLEVWVRADGYDVAELEQTFVAIRRGDRP